jgi:hypothetical protein
MKDLWLVIDATDCSFTITYVPIFANSKNEVGHYIKNNVEKFYDTFVNLYDNDKEFGKIRKKLYNQKNKKYYKMKDNIKKKAEFLKFVKEVISQFSDEDVVDEFWGSSEEYIRNYIKIKKIDKAKIIEI